MTKGQSINNFSTDYWARTDSLVEFQPSRVLPPMLPITAVKLFDIQSGQLLLVAIPSGWDIPGGHIEPGETPSQALEREIEEETGGKVGRAGLVGLLRVTQQQPNSANASYPARSAIALYKGGITEPRLDQGQLQHESTAVGRFDIDQLPDVLLNWSKLSQEIVDYVIKLED